jgi:hypothetical protein
MKNYLVLPAHLPSDGAVLLEENRYLGASSPLLSSILSCRLISYPSEPFSSKQPDISECPLLSSTSKSQSLSHTRSPHADCHDGLVLIEARVREEKGRR